MKDVELAYAAGIFDGEGTVGIYNTGAGRGLEHYGLSLAVASSDPVILEWLQERWGGRFRWSLRSSSKKPVGDWKLNGAAAVAFLIDIQPYLLIKAAQAEVAKSFQATVVYTGGSVLGGARQRVPVAVLEIRRLLSRELRDLKTQPVKSLP